MANLNQFEEKILRWFEKFPPEAKFRVSHVASSLSMTLSSSHYYLEELVKKSHLKRTKLSRRKFLYSLNINND